MNKPTFALLAAALCAPVWAAVTEQDVAAAREPALAGEAPATAQLFRLYDGADGAVAEGINETLGQVAQAHPKLFLTELVSYNGGAACTNIAALGPDFSGADVRKYWRFALGVSPPRQFPVKIIALIKG